MGNDPRERELKRREFLQLAMMSSATLMASRCELKAMEDSRTGPHYAALRDLPPGAVQPEGWLRTYLEKQLAQLGSHLPQISSPFDGAYWAGDNRNGYGTWWPWEDKAYWMDGVMRLALVLQVEPLREAQTMIGYTLSHAGEDGYLGPPNIEDPAGDFHRWPHAIFFRGLAAISDAHQDRNIVEAVRKHFLSDKASYGVPLRNITNIEAMLWCYERTNDPRLVVLAENAWHEYCKQASEGIRGDLTAPRVYADTPIDAHGVTYIETAKQPAILYMYTGRPEYLKFALAAQRRIFEHHMLIDGIPSTTEFYRTTTSLDSHETCDITDHTWTWGYMLMATGDGVWGDWIERACFNAGAGAIRNDWKSLQYFSCPNQFLATLNSNHNVLLHGGVMMAYQPNPGQTSSCCAGNVHRLFPNYVIRMWMKDASGGLAATLYGPSTLKTTVTDDNQPVEVVQETDYPFGEEIKFTIHAEHAVAFPLSLRIPKWCSAPQIKINKQVITFPQVQNGFATLHRTFEPGDTVTLTLPMRLALSEWPENGIGIENGPLVYSLPIKETWTPVVEPKYSTEEFPSWNAMPASAWNYGLALKTSKLEEQVTLHRKAMTDDPWSDPPVTLVVPAKKIEDWELQSDPDNASQKFTPPLPDLSTSKVGHAVEDITLAPYGSTQLRISIFPKILDE